MDYDKKGGEKVNRLKKGNLYLAETQIETIIKEFDAIGLCAAIVEADGTTVYQRFWGYADQASKREADEDTIFGLASVTKSFTALAIMQLAEKNLIDVDDPVGTYIPEFTNGNQKKVTIRHLLTHTGGFFPLPRILIGDVAGELGLSEADDGDFAYHEALAAEGARRVAARLDSLTMESGLNGHPGEYFSYCNDGYGLLSEIVRRKGGERSFADYLNKYILKPLGMNRSFCDFVRPAEDANGATLYQKVNGIRKGSRDYHDNAFVLNGGGALKSTLADMKKYVTMYLNGGAGAGGESIVSEYRIKEMCKGYQPYLAAGGYGYGLAVKQLNDLRMIGHGGSLPGVSSDIEWSYEAGAAAVVLCNTSDVPVNLIAEALLMAYSGYSPVKRRDEFRETQWDMLTIAQAAGSYASGEGTRLRLFEKEPGMMGVEVDGEEKLFVPIHSEAALIRTKFSDAYLSLCRRPDRQVFAVSYGSRLIPREP